MVLTLGYPVGSLDEGRQAVFRGGVFSVGMAPDFASLHPGYMLSASIFLWPQNPQGHGKVS